MSSPEASDHSHAPPTSANRSRELLPFLVGLLLLIGLVAGLGNVAPEPWSGRFQTFATIFLGIFTEALPFLLAGSLVSGLLEVFVSREALARIVPKRPLPAALVGSLLGFAFPVCECGVVPVTRKLYQKGMPLSVGISFLLAAPVINPVVFFSTLAAFGWGPILVGRFVVTVVVAFLIGFLFSFAKPEDILLPQTQDEAHEHDHYIPAGSASFGTRFWSALTISGDDFVDMGRYLIIGSMLAALMQTLVPQATLIALGQGTVISVVTLMVLAFVLSVCSTVDAFIALSFVNSFSSGAILSFLTFGPMVDVKSSLMFLGVFKRRIVAYLILLPLLLNLIVGVLVNLWSA